MENKRGFSQDQFWKVCRTQKEAFSAIQSRPKEENLKIFAKEVNNKSARNYSVCGQESFWKQYICYKGNTAKMLWNEVIREHQPCRLYFDLEFMKKSNPNVDGRKLVAGFIQFICQEIETNFQMTCTPENVLQLDATTNDKFSRHLIFHLPNQKIFENNFTVGRFVKHCCGKLNKLETIDPEQLRSMNLESFYVKKDDKKESFCDQGVYTKNRNFRMFLSNKFEKNNPFMLADDCTFYAETEKPDLKQIFNDSLIEVLEYGVDQFLPFDIETKPSKSCSASSSRVTSALRRDLNSSQEGKISIEEGFCPEIDRQVLDFVRCTTPNVHITKCEALKEYRCLRYVLTSKYCYNVGREHKSHNIMIIVLLRRKVFYQKCFDLDCKGFKSPENALYMSNLAEIEIDNVEKLFCNNSSHFNGNDNSTDFLDASLPDDIALQMADEIDAISAEYSKMNLNL